MSVLMFTVAMAIAATAEESISERVRAHRAARRLPRRARRYKFN